MKYTTLFDKPKVIVLVADVNQGKSMLLYHILDELGKKHTFNLYTYGLRCDLPNTTQVFSVAEIEQVRDSIIVIDELASLFDLNNRKQKRIIENTLRLIHHNNNILVLCGPPENFKKFLSAKADVCLFKKCTISDFVNGSRLKHIVTDYRGPERGSEILNIPKGNALLYDGSHYRVVDAPYLNQYDTKKSNAPILKTKGGKK